LRLSRPVISAAGGEAALIVAFPGVLSGGVNVGSMSQLWGLELNTLASMWHDCHFDVHALAGFRYLDLDENLRVLQRSTELTAAGFSTFRGVPLLPDDILVLNDYFATHSRF